MPRYFSRRAALLLAALVFAFSGCSSNPGPSPDSHSDEPGQAAASPSPSPAVSPSESPSEAPSYSTDASPSPAPSDSPEPSDGAAPSPTPPASASPSPSASESPEVSAPPDERPSAPVGAVPAGDDVGNDWFSDAVFLGDSRTDGLRLYSGIKGATFICHTGLSVFTIGTNACINSDGGKITVMDALAKQQWAKVYLMLGVNELGYSAASFQKTYTEVVDQIKQLQPTAAIYLQTLIPVNEPIAYKNGTNRAINNETLKQFNEIIAQIAQDEGVFLVDVDAPSWSAEGCLDASLTGDGVHLTRAGYTDWFTYLRTHTGSGLAGPGQSSVSTDPTYVPATPPQDNSQLFDGQELLSPPAQATYTQP